MLGTEDYLMLKNWFDQGVSIKMSNTFINFPRKVQSEMNSCHPAHGPVRTGHSRSAEAAGRHGFEALMCEDAHMRARGCGWGACSTAEKI